MIRVGGADKFVVGSVEDVANLADFAGNLVNIFLRSTALGLGVHLYLLTVLVGSRLEEHVVAEHSLVTRDSVGQNNLIAVAYVRLARGIGNRCGDVIRFFVTHE